MRFSQIFRRLRVLRGWPRELLLSVLALGAGFALMPVLIFYSGSLLLGRYEGASVAHQFQSIYGGLQAGSRGLLDRSVGALRAVFAVQGARAVVAGERKARLTGCRPLQRCRRSSGCRPLKLCRTRTSNLIGPNGP